MPDSECQHPPLDLSNIPPANWLWFRVFANLALSKISPDEHYNPTRMKDDLDHLDTFQLRGDESGWSRDGPEGVLQLDYYSGSFAIQFAQLAYSKLMQKEDPERCENYRKRALRFSLDLLYYFDQEGESALIASEAVLTVRRTMYTIWSVHDLPIRRGLDLFHPPLRIRRPARGLSPQVGPHQRPRLASSTLVGHPRGYL